jgi:4-amino-4-deoxy-L-arabinose transferase-like glycosyltransferase
MSAIIQGRGKEATAAYSKSTVAIISLLTAVAAALRFAHLDQRGLSLDESITVAIARLVWTDIRTVLTSREEGATLYHLLLHYWTRLGTSECFVRSLSALFGTATIVLLYMLGRRMFGTRAGLTAAALLAVNGYHIRYSQDAQSYSLVVLLAVLTSLLLVEAVQRGSYRTWNWYTGISVVSGYVHPIGVLVTLAQFVSLPFAEKRKENAKDIRQSAIWIAVGWLPLVWFLAVKKGQGTWASHVSLQTIHEQFFDFAGVGNHLLLAFYAVTTVVAITGVLMKGHLYRCLRWHFGLVIFWTLLPFALTVALTFRKSTFDPGLLILILPALVLMLSAVLDWIPSPLIQGLALALVLGISLSGVRAAYGTGFEPKREYMREVTRYILNNSRRGDGAVFYAPQGRIAFEYYRDMHSASVIRPRVFYPLRGDGLLTVSASASDPALLAPDTLLMAEVAQRQRLWLVQTGDPDEKYQALQKWLGERFPHMERHGFGPTRFFLYSR